MKKIISLLICILLCVSLIGCGNENTENEIISTTVSEQISNQEENISTADSSSAETSNNEKSTVGKTATSKTTEKQKQPEITAATTDAKKTTASTTSAVSDITCTVTIECKSILDKTDKLKAGHEAFVPQNGIMLDSYTVTVRNGSTAFDAVKQACSSGGISMNATNSSYGSYIVGFNNIDEKDCGSASGWLYYVNDSQPNKSCSKYAVKNGDSIVFSYTC